MTGRFRCVSTTVTSDPVGSRWWSGMAERRGLSSVADISLALVLVVAGVAALATVADTGTVDHDPDRAAHTAETLGASTFDVSYSLAPVLVDDSKHVRAVDDERAPYDPADFDRSTHGSAIGHMARAALSNAGFPGERGRVYPLAVGAGYERALAGQLAVSLVGSSFATNVTVTWEPFDGATVRGVAGFGRPIPPETDRSVTRTTVPSELPDARDVAVDAVAESKGYAAVAAAVADAIVNGSLGETQRELETTGVERAVVVSRYLRFADGIDGLDRGHLDGSLGRSRADAGAMTRSLADALAAQLEAELHSTFETPAEAAEAVSTGEVTIAVTTWKR